MSCETCGREVKNYGVFLGGVTCANRCGLRDWNTEKKMLYIKVLQSPKPNFVIAQLCEQIEGEKDRVIDWEEVRWPGVEQAVGYLLEVTKNLSQIPKDEDW